jgi:hypothetical protein
MAEVGDLGRDVADGRCERDGCGEHSDELGSSTVIKSSASS